MQIIKYLRYVVYTSVVALVVFTSVCHCEEDEQKSCRVSDIHVEENFDSEAFSGTWYVAMDTGFFCFQRAFDAVFYTMQDLKYYFQLQEDGNFKLITSARSFLLCNSAVGVAQVDSSNAAKMQVSYPGAWAARLSEPRPFWVVSTDYKDYALVYSCRQVEEDGSCNADHTVALTLSRSQSGHSADIASLMSDFGDELCIDGAAFKPMPHSRPCPDIKPEDYVAPTSSEEPAEASDDDAVVDEGEL